MNGPTQAPIPGAELDSVHTPEQVFAAGGGIDGERVLVYDTDGYFTAVAMAEMLMAAGKQVTVVTPFANFAMYMFFTGEGFRVNRELRAEGATIVPSHLVTEIGAGERAAARGSGRPTRSSGTPTPSCSSPSASRATRSTTS